MANSAPAIAILKQSWKEPHILLWCQSENSNILKVIYDGANEQQELTPPSHRNLYNKHGAPDSLSSWEFKEIGFWGCT